MECRCVKIVRITFVVLVLLAAAACNRTGRSPPDLPTEGALAPSDDSSHQPAHDPRAMTAIDVATGDLSGWGSYAHDRAIPLAANHARAGNAQPGATTNLATQVLEAPVATPDGAAGGHP